MLCHELCGRCYNHHDCCKMGWCCYPRWGINARCYNQVADGIAIEWNVLVYGRCYCHCGRWISHWGVGYLNLSFEMLNRTSSHIWGRWYLPMFMLRDGLLTLVHTASFICLMRFWSSLPTILKFSSKVVWLVMLQWSYIGEGGFRCSLNLSPKILDYSPIHFLSHSTLSHLYL